MLYDFFGILKLYVYICSIGNENNFIINFNYEGFYCNYEQLCYIRLNFKDCFIFWFLIDVGVRNERWMCVVNYNKFLGFEIVKGLLDRVMQLMEILFQKGNDGYYIEVCDGQC